MDKLGVNFLDLSRETFKDFTVGKEGQENHICSSKKMHRIVNCATQTAALKLETWTMLGPWQRLFTDGLLEDHSTW